MRGGACGEEEKERGGRGADRAAQCQGRTCSSNDSSASSWYVIPRRASESQVTVRVNTGGPMAVAGCQKPVVMLNVPVRIGNVGSAARARRAKNMRLCGGCRGSAPSL